MSISSDFLFTHNIVFDTYILLFVIYSIHVYIISVVLAISSVMY